MSDTYSVRVEYSTHDLLKLGVTAQGFAVAHVSADGPDEAMVVAAQLVAAQERCPVCAPYSGEFVRTEDRERLVTGTTILSVSV
jgi:hypothetical protein